MAEENDGEPVDDLALMKRAYTNKKTGQIDDGLVREVVTLVQTQSVPKKKGRLVGLGRRTRDSFLGIFRGLRSSEIPDENSEEHFVGTSEDWTIGKSIEISRGSSPSVYSEDLSDELVVLRVSSEFRRKFPRDFRGKMNFRGVISEDFFRRTYYLKILCTPGWCQDHAMVDDGCFGGQFLVLTTIRFVMESEQARYSQSCLLFAK
uniref:Uncharacterized protein n=1 Tax=Brassica oleracea var. oleracea TaxID=109376 RepID=A0A0D3AVF9_BRAOL